MTAVDFEKWQNQNGRCQQLLATPGTLNVDHGIVAGPGPLENDAADHLNRYQKQQHQ
jgi:hypothetical protein